MSKTFQVGKATISRVVQTTARHLRAKLLSRAINLPNDARRWASVREKFWTLWNIPACGAIDGKLIRLIAPPNCGSLYYSYKGFHAMILLAVSAADGAFLYVNVGAPGSNCDSNVYCNSQFFNQLSSGSLNLPSPFFLPQTRISVHNFFLADAAFPGSIRIVKPLPNSKCLSPHDVAYTYRISRGRRIVENSFGRLVRLFPALDGPLRTGYLTSCDIVTSMCILSNFLLDTAPDHSSSLFADAPSGPISPAQQMYNLKLYFNSVGVIPSQVSHVKKLFK